MRDIFEIPGHFDKSGTFSGTLVHRGQHIGIGDCPRKSGTSGHPTVEPPLRKIFMCLRVIRCINGDTLKALLFSGMLLFLDKIPLLVFGSLRYIFFEGYF